MLNGHRRGGTYVRGGKTFHRRGANIDLPSKRELIGLAVVGVGFVSLVGGGSPLIGVVVVVGALGLIAYKNRARIRAFGQGVSRHREERQALREPAPAVTSQAGVRRQAPPAPRRPVRPARPRRAPTPGSDAEVLAYWVAQRRARKRSS